MHLEVQKLEKTDGLGGVGLYNLACLYMHEGERERALSVLRKSIERGYHDIEGLRRDPDLDPLRGTPEFEELVKELEEKIVTENNG